MSALFKKNKEDKAKAMIGEEERKAELLSEEVLDQVNGAGNPFDNIPRVPTQEIDDDLRDRV